MKQRAPEEILDHHFDTLHQYGEPRARLIETDSALPEDSASLFTVVQWLWQTLQPVQPSPAFKDELLLQLLTEYERQRVQQRLGIRQASRAFHPMTWIVPVAVGTASLVGVYAFWRRTRQTIREDAAVAA